MNREGYRDPTADRAIQNYTKRVSDLIHVLRSVAAVGGFEIVGRIAIKDKKTGETFR